MNHNLYQIRYILTSSTTWDSVSVSYARAGTTSYGIPKASLLRVSPGNFQQGDRRSRRGRLSHTICQNPLGRWMWRSHELVGTFQAAPPPPPPPRKSIPTCLCVSVCSKRGIQMHREEEERDAARRSARVTNDIKLSNHMDVRATARARIHASVVVQIREAFLRHPCAAWSTELVDTIVRFYCKWYQIIDLTLR